MPLHGFAVARIEPARLDSGSRFCARNGSFLTNNEEPFQGNWIQLLA